MRSRAARSLAASAAFSSVISARSSVLTASSDEGCAETAALDISKKTDAIRPTGRIVATLLRLSLHVLDPQRQVGNGPDAAELGAGARRGGGLALRRQRLPHPEQRAAVPRVVFQIVAKDLLGLGRVTGGEQRGAERLAYRVVPRGRLVVGQQIPGRDSGPVFHNRRHEIAGRGGDAAVEQRLCHGEHLPRRV